MLLAPRSRAFEKHILNCKKWRGESILSQPGKRYSDCIPEMRRAVATLHPTTFLKPTCAKHCLER
jgi:hypothetical protein